MRRLTMALVLQGTLSLLASLPSLAADPTYCALWSREFTRIEACSGIQFRMILQGQGFLFVGTPDVDMATASPELIESRTIVHFHECGFLVEFSSIPLPKTPCTETKAWSMATSQAALGRQGSVPASEPEAKPESGLSGFPAGSEDWLAWCRVEFPNTWEEDTQTVRRHGRGDRVPCPG